MNRQLDYLKVVLLGQLTIEAIEDLEGTNMYRHNLKNQGKKFVSMMESLISKDYNSLFEKDQEMTQNMLRKVSELIDKLKTNEMNELVMIAGIIDKYNNNKEWFNENMPIDFLKLD